jgi:pimeloyl-ACP methyl ester carboxylesterase
MLCHKSDGIFVEYRIFNVLNIDMHLYRKFKKMYIVLFLLLGYILIFQSCMTMRTTTSETRKFFEKKGVAFTDEIISVENHPIHYIQTGRIENPTLFFVHGSPGSWDAFKDYLADSLLLKKYRMIAVDRPGFGYSDFGEAEDLLTQSKWLSEFIEKVDNHQPVILVGHSLGGPVIAKMSALLPSRYEHLVILSGALDPYAEKTEKWRLVIKQKPIRYLIPGALRPSNDELWWLKEDLIDLKRELKNITSKVTIVHGTKDPLVPYSNVGFMTREFVNAKSIDVISIENANHFIPWEHYQLIRDELLELK